MGWNPISWVESAVKTVTDPFLKHIAKKGGWRGLLSGGLKQFAFSFIASAVLSFAYKKLAGKPKQPDFQSFTNEAIVRKALIRSPVADRSIIYGTVRKGGAIVHAETLNNNADLYMVIALCGHEVNSIGSVFFNDTEIQSGHLDGSGNVNTGTFNGKAQIIKHTGSSTQTVDTVLDGASTVWTSDHRLRGIAYLMVKLTYDVDVYPNGIPNISAVIEGKKIYNVSTTATAYSNNPANVIYDYLRSSDGFGASASEIDTTTFAQAYADCNDSISITGGTQSRYTCNGVILLNRKPVEVIEDLISSCAGTLTFQQGKFKLKVGKATSSTRTLTDDDFAGDLKIATRPKRSQLYNKVKGTFIDADTNFSIKEFNTQESSSYQTSDGETIINEIELPFTTNAVEAQRLALIVLKQSRQMMTLDIMLKPEHLDLGVGDVIAITNTKLGFTAKKFYILAYTLNADLSVSIVAQEYADAVFDFTAGSEQVTLATASAISLPSPTSVTAPSSITTSDGLTSSNDGIISVDLTATIAEPTEAFIGQYELEYKKSTDSTYIFAGRSSNNTFIISNVEDGVTYNLRGKIINTIGVSSSYVTANHLVIGKITPPNDIANFRAEPNGNQLVLSWDAPTDLDLSHITINYANTLSNADFQNSTVLVKKVGRPATSVTIQNINGAFLCFAVDKIGNMSTNPAIIYNSTANINNLNLLETINEHTNYGGTVSSTAVAENVLMLATSELFDSASGDVDDATTKNFDGGTTSANLVSEGTYDFENTYDLGSLQTTQITAQITQSVGDRDRLFDNVGTSTNNATGFMDDEPNNFDGDAPSKCGTQILYASSTDNVTFGSYQVFTSTQVYTRYLKFRAKLTSDNGSATPLISQLKVQVDMPDRVISANNQTSSSGVKAISFSPVMKTTNYALGLAIDNMATGDYYTITSKTASGFQVNFFNSSNSAIDRQFDYIARGY